jgi:hypothetical protein
MNQLEDAANSAGGTGSKFVSGMGTDLSIKRQDLLALQSTPFLFRMTGWAPRTTVNGFIPYLKTTAQEMNVGKSSPLSKDLHVWQKWLAC